MGQKCHAVLNANTSNRLAASPANAVRYLLTLPRSRASRGLGPPPSLSSKKGERLNSSGEGTLVLGNPAPSACSRSARFQAASRRIYATVLAEDSPSH